MTSPIAASAAPSTPSPGPDRTVDFRYAPTTVWTAICRPDQADKTLVRQDGALLYDLIADLNVWCFSRVIEFGIRTDLRPIEYAQRTEDARTPIVHTLVRYPNLTLALTAFRHVDATGRCYDVVRWEIGVDEGGDEFLAELLITARERARFFAGPTAKPSSAIYAVPFADSPTTSVRDAMLVESLSDDTRRLPVAELAFVSVPHPVSPVADPGFGPVPVLASEAALLQPGETTAGAVIVPLGHVDGDGLDLAWVDAALASERAFWRDLDLLRLPIEIPDPGIMAMVEAAARNILQAREFVDGLPEFRVGSAVFRGLWVVDGHFLLEAARYLGYRDDALAGLDVLLRRAHADGTIAEMPFHTKETAIAITTFVRQSELDGDDELLRRLWPTIRRGVDYIESLRQQAYALPDDSPAFGLLPPSFADGGIGGLRPEFTSTFWTLAGLKAVTRAARRLGYAEDAARFDRLFIELLRDFRSHAARDRQTLPDGTPYLPTVMLGSGDHTWTADYPGTPPVWRQIRPQTGTWAYAQAIYPGEVFSPDDPLVPLLLDLLDTVDDEQGLPGNTAFWTYRMVWTYSGSFYAHAWLFANRPDKAIDYLYAFANHAAPTRVWREEQPVTTAHTLLSGGDMPHNWASAEFIRLVRHLLVFERGETLELLPGLPLEWLGFGTPVRLERTPTRFGPVTIVVDPGADGIVRIAIARDLTWDRQPERVVLHVPRGFQIDAMTAAGNVLSPAGRAVGAVDLPVAAWLNLRLSPAAEA